MYVIYMDGFLNGGMYKMILYGIFWIEMICRVYFDIEIGVY